MTRSAVPVRTPTGDRWSGWLIGAIFAGCATALMLGVYARVHHPTGAALDLAGFSSAAYAKAWVATFAAVLALVQVGSGARPHRTEAPAWTAPVHRWSGRVALIVTVPVAVHCMYALGFQWDGVRVLLHSVLGCLFYGAFVAKMLVLTRRGMPSWSIPVLGGLLFTALAGLWLTSALWLFTTKGLHL
ncbi:DUF6529 family protein [Actinomycetospora chiangmaiensis]|uniref:DUF6529 family protein n=1 Tax=Actinomycetospora chiangmaiensis TaxID=402650 RepID=UPI00035E82D0|nr:DUF6529 family protein [Actinomycetospora chiangmaiensis]